MDMLVALQGVRRLLADSAAFQRRLGVADAVAAGRRILGSRYRTERGAEALAELRPLAGIWIADSFDLERLAGGSATVYGGAVGVALVLSDNDLQPGDGVQAGVRSEELFVGWVDAVLRDVLAAAGTSDQVRIEHVQALQTPLPSDPREGPSPYWDVCLLLRVGW